MLKIRLIPVLYIKNGLIVRSETFSYHQNIGNIINEAQRYNDWDVDELIYIDISREKTYDLRRNDHKIGSYCSIDEVIRRISTVCFMPLSFGGGIRTLEDIDLRIRNGADKVVLNTGAFDNPTLISGAARKYGSQCVVISIDYKVIQDTPIVFTNFGQKNTSVNLFEWIRICEGAGAGEVFINSIERDGKAEGYDIVTIREACMRASVPVIACGGAGASQDFLELARATSVSGMAAGNLFHFTERSYPKAKTFLREQAIHVR